MWSSYIIIVKFFLNLAPKWSLSWDDEVALWVNELDAKFNNLSSIHGIYNIKGEFILTGYPLTFICMEIINIFDKVSHSVRVLTAMVFGSKWMHSGFRSNI